MMDFEKYNHSVPTRHPNFLLVPVTRFEWNDKDVEEFNEIYTYCKDNIPKKITRTKSGGISTAGRNFIGSQWDIHETTSMIEITVFNKYGGFRFQIGHNKKENFTMSGRVCWLSFQRIAKSMGVDISTMALTSEEGKSVKETIPKPIIKCMMNKYLAETFEHCNHLDLNSSYMAGIAFKYTDLYPVIKNIYDRRKTKKHIFKDILTHTFGFMQSQFVGYQYSHMSKAAIEFNNSRIEYLKSELQRTGHKVIGINTDGIWYQGEVFHNELEGEDLGQFKNDHIDCTLRYKSDGVYEYIENGVYHPVFRGCSSYERIKPREQWEWGDIFKGESCKYYWDKEKGIMNCETV